MKLGQRGCKKYGIFPRKRGGRLQKSSSFIFEQVEPILLNDDKKTLNSISSSRVKQKATILANTFRLRNIQHTKRPSRQNLLSNISSRTLNSRTALVSIVDEKNEILSKNYRDKKSKSPYLSNHHRVEPLTEETRLPSSITTSKEKVNMGKQGISSSGDTKSISTLKRNTYLYDKPFTKGVWLNIKDEGKQAQQKVDRAQAVFKKSQSKVIRSCNHCTICDDIEVTSLDSNSISTITMDQYLMESKHETKREKKEIPTYTKPTALQITEQAISDMKSVFVSFHGSISIWVGHQFPQESKCNENK